VEHVCRRTDEYKYGGRVTIGHVTKATSLAPDNFESMAHRLAGSGVALTVLPSTDLFLMGRHHKHDHNITRGVVPAHKLIHHGVNCALSSNNVLNPFTPFGDCSLMRMANLYANIAQWATAPISSFSTRSSPKWRWPSWCRCFMPSSAGGAHSPARRRSCTGRSDQLARHAVNHQQ
jgi:hypothetical protein